jgi:hypothetical protein
VILKRFRLFLREWQIGNKYIYREQLNKNINLGKHYIEVDIEDLNNHDQELAEFLHK